MNSNATSLYGNATVRQVVAFAVGIIIVLGLSFQSGRSIQRLANRAELFRQRTDSPSSVDKRYDRSDTSDLEKVLIANVATVGFGELYDIFRSAPIELRTRWAAQLDAMPEGAQRTAALESFYKTFVQIDPAAAAASIDALHDVDTKMIAAEATVGAVPASGMQYIAAMLLKLPREFVSTHSWDYLSDIVEQWSAIDPEALARFFDQHPHNDLENYHGALVYIWAQLDPNAALAWLERQPLPKEKGLFPPFDELVSGWFQRDHVAAENYLIAHAGEEKLQGVVPRIASGSFGLSPTDAIAFINRLPNNELKKQSLTEVSRATDSVSWPNDWTRPPVTVANWMLTFPQEWRGPGLANVIENWKKQDEAGLVVWMNQLPSPVRDQVALDYCYNFGMYDEEFLVPLVSNVSDSVARDAAMEDFLSKWLPDDREDAVKKIRESPLTATQKGYLLKLLPRIPKKSASD